MFSVSAEKRKGIEVPAKIQLKKESKLKTAKKMWPLYVMVSYGIIHVFIFSYLPMYGVSIAFKNFNFGDGIWGSPWNNFAHFKVFFSDFFFLRVITNTLRLSFLQLVIGFPAPIIFALLINEIGNLRFKKIIQSVSYLPYFLSWVVVADLIIEILSPQRGIVSYILTLLGMEPIYFIQSTYYILPIIVISSIWKNVGWNSVIYIASISSISTELYESAETEGANRLQRALYITLPGLSNVITIMLILQLGRILNNSFDQVFNFYNPLTYEVADIIDTFVYRKGIEQAQYDFASAVGLFQQGVGLILVIITNFIAKKINDFGIW